jgi:hypothetical protein
VPKHAFNTGVAAVLKIAERTAEAINRTSMRHVHEDFAVAALGELAEAGRALLLPLKEPDADAEAVES